MKQYFVLAIFAAILGLDSAYAVAAEFRVVDRRDLDGTVLLVRWWPPKRVGTEPFKAASTWELVPVTEFFRVRGPKLPARYLSPGSDPPAITFEGGKVVPNSWTAALGGSPSTYFEPGEPVRLVRINTAFSTVRMDLEALCRHQKPKSRLRGRVDFNLSGQVGEKTFAEANSAVRAVLEPIDMSRVLEHCDPETGRPPITLRRGMTIREVRDALGPPAEEKEEGQETELDYALVRILFFDGVVRDVLIPAID